MSACQFQVAFVTPNAVVAFFPIFCLFVAQGFLVAENRNIETAASLDVLDTHITRGVVHGNDMMAKLRQLPARDYRGETAAGSVRAERDAMREDACHGE